MTDEQYKALMELMTKCLDATNTCLAYFEQLSDQYEQLRQEHVKHHGGSMLPIQIRRKKS